MAHRTIPRAGIGALALAGVLFVAACGGGGGSNPQVASLGEGASGPTTTAAPGGSSNGSSNGDEADAQQAMLDFAACMREHGVDMPDPQFDADGKAAIAIGGGPSDLDTAKVNEAQKACDSYLQKVRENMPPPDPAKVEEEKQKLLQFAQCMRDHGIDFPDPQISSDGGGIQVQMGAGEGGRFDPESPAFKEANEACAAQTGTPALPAGRAAASVGSQP